MKTCFCSSSRPISSASGSAWREADSGSFIAKHQLIDPLEIDKMALKCSRIVPVSAVGGFSQLPDDLIVLQSSHHGLKMPVITAPKMQPGLAVDDKITGRGAVRDHRRDAQGRRLIYDQRFR